MNYVRLFEEHKCCVHGLSEHFVIEPKLLGCGHPTCQMCITNSKIKCFRFNKINSLDLDTAPLEVTMIESHLEQLSKELYGQIKNAENEIEGLKNDLENEINSKFEWIEGEIEIAIESLKAKLNDINQSFKTKLKEYKNKVEKLLLKPIDKIKAKTEKFNQDIQRNYFNLETFYDNNSNLLNIGLLLDKMKTFNLEVNFDFNEEFVLDEDSVGSFSCNIDEYNTKRPIDIVETGKPEYIELDYEPLRIVELKNKNILVGSSEDSLLALYDSEFKLLRKITEINDEKIRPYGIACDQNGNVFVTNGFDSLYKLDSELNWIKSIECDCYSHGITIYKNKIYVCRKNCVRVYSLELDVTTDHYFEDMPLLIGITSNMACIQFRRTTENNEITRFTRFHKLPLFELVIEHILAGPILAYNTMFYLYDVTGFTVLDKNGKTVKKIQKSIGENKYCNSGMNCFNNALYICLDGNRICKIVH